jgi:hypothetical protein
MIIIHKNILVMTKCNIKLNTTFILIMYSKEDLLLKKKHVLVEIAKTYDIKYANKMKKHTLIDTILLKATEKKEEPKEEPKIKVEIIKYGDDGDSEDEEEEINNEEITIEDEEEKKKKKEKELLKTKICIKSLKIKLKIFIHNYVNTLKDKGLKSDLIDLIRDILIFNDIELTTENDFKPLFCKIYKLDYHKQLAILKEINFYLTNYE